MMPIGEAHRQLSNRVTVLEEHLAKALDAADYFWRRTDLSISRDIEFKEHKRNMDIAADFLEGK